MRRVLSTCALALAALALVAAVAVEAAVRVFLPHGATIKWPNDLLIGERKLAGVLAERADDAVVIGMGLNVSLRQEELPVETATSLAIEGAARAGRQEILCAALGELERWYPAWAGGASPGNPDASGLRAEYRGRSVTLGRPVRVEFPGGKAARGTALDVDAEGRLLLRTAGGPLAVSAGDVVHLR
jgi:BirA family biotin operon repressor/biotin-[acetyl-CoA-carboxylase] ligase